MRSRRSAQRQRTTPSVLSQAVFYPLRYFAPLGFGQTRLTQAGPVPAQPSHPRLAITQSAASAVHGPACAANIANAHPAHGNGECAAPAGVKPSAPLARNCEILDLGVNLDCDMLPLHEIMTSA